MDILRRFARSKANPRIPNPKSRIPSKMNNSMGRKSSAKTQSPPPVPPAGAPKRGSGPIVAAIAAVVVAVGLFAYLRQAGPPAERTAAAATPQSVAVPDPPAVNLKPHPQQNLPALQFPGYPTPRSPEVVRAAYTFAAEHPQVGEVLASIEAEQLHPLFLRMRAQRPSRQRRLLRARARRQRRRNRMGRSRHGVRRLP